MDIPIAFYWNFSGISMAYLYGTSMMHSMGYSMDCLCDFCIGFLWDFYGILYDVSMGCLLGFLWYFHDASMIFLWDCYGIPEGIL